MRKLLPYEYQLIEQLGISKEEYLEFIAVQAAYDDVKIGTVFDARSEVVSAVVAIVGLIFSVASTLLRPKPQISAPRGQGVSVGTPPPGAATEGIGGQAQTREQRFSPRFGFNGQQDLAKYGDPVNLIYCNTDINPKGAVRAATSLVWSAVRSYGSSQFVQLLLVLGAGRIAGINADKSAFGQVALEDLVAQNKFFYHNNQGTGFLSWNDEEYGRASTDPTFYGTGLNNPYRLQPEPGDTRIDGFSQAYSPGTQNAFGVYGVVPINTFVYQRNDIGNKLSAVLGISGDYSWTAGQELTIDTAITLTIKNTKDDVDDVNTQAQETRRTLSSVFDASGIFKLGSAVFRVTNINTGSPDEQDMIINLICIERGFAPYVAYADLTGANSGAQRSTEILDEPAYINALNILKVLEVEDERVGKKLIGYNDDGNISSFEYQDYTFVNVIEGTAPEGYELADETFGPNDAFARGRAKTAQGVYKTRYESRTAEDYYGDAFNPSRGGDNLVSVAVGYYKARDVTKDELAAYSVYNQKRASSLEARSGAELFFTKALARAESASYRTIQQCNIVDFAIKSRVFKRISGRQERYGSSNVGGYPISDNGNKNRTAMFLFKYRKAGETAFTIAPAIIAVSRAADIDNFNYLKFASTLPTAQYWEFKLESIAESFAEIRKYKELRKDNGSTDFLYLDNSPNAVSISLPGVGTLQAAGRILNSNAGFPPLNETVSGISEWDLFNLDADNQCQFSFEAGPEFALTCVTEQQTQSFSAFPNLYKNLSMVGLNLYSGRNLQDLRSFTAFVTKGRLSTLLDGGGVGCACHAPDIFLDTVVDSEDGIGKYAKIEGVDVAQLTKTKRFCRVNKLFMDGIIADTTNWRQFWVDAAPFSLLEFARIGGRETLIPAVPYDENTGAMSRIVNVTALFNQGNIMEGSYKEEHLDYGSSVQDLIATVVYRGADINGTFSANRAIEVKLKDTSEVDAVRETFYVAQFVSTREQAIIYGKFLCQIRRHIKVGIEFKTFPTMDPVSPGAFIYVDIGQNSWDGIRTGIIGPGGVLNIPMDNSLPDASYEFLLYQSGNAVISRVATTSSNTAAGLADLDGYLFVLGQKTTTRRVFRVTEVEMDEEGEITVRGTNYPCTSDGLSEIANFNDAKFTVIGALD